MGVVVDAQSCDPVVQLEQLARLAVPDLRVRRRALEVQTDAQQRVAPADAEQRVAVPASRSEREAETGQARPALIGFGNIAGLGNEGYVRLRLHVEHFRPVLVAPSNERIRVLDHRDWTFVLVNHHILVGEPAFLIHDQLPLQTSTNK